MNKNEIKLGRLDIRLKGGDVQSARDLRLFGAAIGDQVLQQIAQQVNQMQIRRSIRISNIDAGTVCVENSRASGSRAVIAGQIADRVSSKTAPVPSRGKR